MTNQTKLTINQATTAKAIQQISDFAIAIWHEYFPQLLSSSQIDYMCELFNTPNAMKTNIDQHHYQYYGVYDKKTLIGYIALQDTPQYLFLSKLYLCNAARHHGYASQLMDFVVQQAKNRGYHSIQLTCNKYNTHSLDVYDHFGFKTIDSDQTDIGHGYIMDDYIMEKVI